MSNISSALKRDFSDSLVFCEACDGKGYVYPFAYLRDEARPSRRFQLLAPRTCRLCLGRLPKQIDIDYPNPSISGGFKVFSNTAFDGD